MIAKCSTFFHHPKNCSKVFIYCCGNFDSFHVVCKVFFLLQRARTAAADASAATLAGARPLQMCLASLGPHMFFCKTASKREGGQMLANQFARKVPQFTWNCLHWISRPKWIPQSGTPGVLLLCAPVGSPCFLRFSGPSRMAGPSQRWQQIQ